jgi:hypothetical protein
LSGEAALRAFFDLVEPEMLTVLTNFAHDLIRESATFRDHALACHNAMAAARRDAAEKGERRVSPSKRLAQFS